MNLPPVAGLAQGVDQHIIEDRTKISVEPIAADASQDRESIFARRTLIGLRGPSD